jgi:succinate-semialdehyde dehydrogenase/glutarate-semialdehyde dehydrogenase
MELGGHSPVIVFDDVDPEKAADFAAGGKYRNAGQVCISPTRFFVQENSYKKFAARFAEKAKAVKLGNGLDKDTQMGPLANARRLEAMASIVVDCQGRGAKVATGGTRRGNQGYFFEPTVITDIEDDSKLMTQEPFGPIAPIIPFRNFDEVVARANSLEYGLAAYAFTSSTKTANAIGDALQSGMVGINTFAISMAETPFGGVKESGYGHEGSVEGLEAYTSKKFISQA